MIVWSSGRGGAPLMVARAKRTSGIQPIVSQVVIPQAPPGLRIRKHSVTAQVVSRLTIHKSSDRCQPLRAAEASGITMTPKLVKTCVKISSGRSVFCQVDESLRALISAHSYLSIDNLGLSPLPLALDDPLLNRLNHFIRDVAASEP